MFQLFGIQIPTVFITVAKFCKSRGHRQGKARKNSSDKFDFFCSIARRLGLKSKSFGKKEDRFITISRKFNGDDVIAELLAKGGSNEKYDLIPPSTN